MKQKLIMAAVGALVGAIAQDMYLNSKWRARFIVKRCAKNGF